MLLSCWCWLQQPGLQFILSTGSAAYSAGIGYNSLATVHAGNSHVVFLPVTFVNSWTEELPRSPAGVVAGDALVSGGIVVAGAFASLCTGQSAAWAEPTPDWVDPRFFCVNSRRCGRSRTSYKGVYEALIKIYIHV